MNRPRLVDGARLRYDDVREEHQLLIPEGAVRLNETAAQVLELCDGMRSLEEIAAALSERYSGADVADDVRELLERMRERGLVVEHCLRPDQQERAVAALRFKTEMLWAQLEAIERGDTQPEGAA